MTTAEKPLFMRMEEVTEFSQMSPEQQQIYMRSLNNYRTFLATNDYKCEYVDGYAEGYAEGRAEVKMAIANQMKADGMPMPLIVKYTGLSEDDVNSL